MTKEEVAKEFARLVAPTLRKMYTEHEKRVKEIKANKGINKKIIKERTP